MKTTRLRIESDGTPQGTRVTTEDGTLVKGIQHLVWHLGTGGLASVAMEFKAMAIDAVGNSEIEVHPDYLSMPPDPDVTVMLAEQQTAPQGPGFSPVPQETYYCETCGKFYDDGDEICTGDDEFGEHEPTPVVATPISEKEERRGL